MLGLMLPPSRRAFLADGRIQTLCVLGSHAIRIGFALLLIKLIAKHYGPAGLLAAGNALSLSTFINAYAGGGIGLSVPKFVSQLRTRPRALTEFLGSALAYLLAVAAAVALVCVGFSTPLSIWVGGDTHIRWLILTLPLLHLLAALGVFFVGLANGMRRSDLMLAIVGPASLVALVTALAGSWLIGLDGLIAALFVTPALTGVTGALILWRRAIWRRLRFALRTKWTSLILKFSLMSAVSAIAFPFGEIVVRKIVSTSIGVEAAGGWQALTRLSTSFLGVFSVALASRYMPTLSGMTSLAEIRGVVLRTLVLAGGSFGLCALGIYLARDLVVDLLFSSEFDLLSTALATQLVGDTFRLLSYVIVFAMIAKGRVGMVMLAEVIQTFLWIASAAAASATIPSLEMFSTAYAAAYGLYFLILACALAVIWRRETS
jgi:O-antigen/teichoic acid export membrane protein